MPDDAVDNVRAMYEALEKDGPEGMLPFVDPQFEGVVPPELSAEPDAYRGHDGIRRYFALFDEVVEDLRFHAEEFERVGDSVIADVVISGRGRGSGAEVEMQIVIAAEVRDGVVTRMTAYPDRPSAREKPG